MKDTYYRMERKRKKKRDGRLFLLSGIAVVVCIGVIAAAAVMNSRFGDDVTGMLSSAASVASSSEASLAASSEPEVSSEELPSVVSSEPVISSVPETVDDAGVNVTKEGFDFSKPVGSSAAVDNSFFNDTVLLGESRAKGFYSSSGLSNMKSYAEVSRTVSKVISTDLPKVKATPNKYKKAYIMLGTNEIGSNYDTAMSNFEKLIDGLRACQKDIEIYVQAVLPITQKCHNAHNYLRKDRIVAFNKRIQLVAEKKQVYFVNPTSALAGADGFLPASLAANDGYHLKKNGYLKQLAYLKTHTVK